MTELAKPRTLVLVGPPAVGKSTVGAVLARRLGVDFCDVDELIVQRTGRPITEIFATDGESGFRAIELDATRAALAAGGVVALGGGAVTNSELRADLATHEVIWLQASVREAVLRVGPTTIRPLLVGDVAGRWSKLASDREPLYAAVATLTISTDNQTPAQIARQIIEQLDLQETR